MKIMVIDDNEIDLWIAKKVIKSAHPLAEVLTCGNTSDAFNKIEEGITVDMIILDLDMAQASISWSIMQC